LRAGGSSLNRKTLLLGLTLAMGISGAIVTLLLALGCLAGTSAPVGWLAWIAKVFLQDAEAVGGLFVAVIQMSIALSFTVGVLLFDHRGYQSTFVTSAAVLALSAALTAMTSRTAAAQSA